MVGIFVILTFAYTSYFYWIKYPFLLDAIFRKKDKRLDKVLSRIWTLNVNARAIAVHKLMRSQRNQLYIYNCDSELLKKYMTFKKYWFWSLGAFVVAAAVSQFGQGYEYFSDPEAFKAKVNDSWFMRLFK